MNNLYGKDQTKPVAPAFMKNEAKTDIMDRTRSFRSAGGGALAHPVLFARLGGAIDRANGVKPLAKAPNIGRPPMATTGPVMTPDRAASLPSPAPAPVNQQARAAFDEMAASHSRVTAPQPAPPPVAAAPVTPDVRPMPAQEAQMRQQVAQMEADRAKSAAAFAANPPAAPVARPAMSPQEQAMKQMGQGGLGAVLPPVQQPVMRQPVGGGGGGFSIRPVGYDEATTQPVDPSMLRY